MGGRRNGWRVACAVAVLTQLVVLYAPRAPSTPGLPGLDKIVHGLIFAAAVATTIPAGLRLRWAVAIFGVHAVISEVVQGALLAHRSADPRDVLADLVGVGVGVVVGAAVHNRLPRPLPGGSAGGP